MSKSESVQQWANDQGVSRIEEYFGPWAYEEQRFARFVDSVRSMKLAAHIKSTPTPRLPDSQNELPERTNSDGILVLPLHGTLMKFTDSLSGGTSTVWARQIIRTARREKSVRAVVIAIDSPGGTVAGTADLAGDIAALAAEKPVVAFIEDLGASAAYWLACATSRIIATATSLVGSIGTFCILEDSSKAAEMEGVKVHVIRTGAMKGAGVPGTEITGEILNEAAHLVTQLNAHFLAAVSKGRRLKGAALEGVSDGRVWIADEAKGLGLIDQVGSFQDAMATASAMIKKSGGGGDEPTTRNQNSRADAMPAAAASLPKVPAKTAAELALDRERAEFREHCMSERGMTFKESGEAWLDYLLMKNPSLKIVDGFTGQVDAGNAIERWEAAIDAEVARGKSKKDAIRTLTVQRPELHAAYLVAYNSRENPAHRNLSRQHPSNLKGQQ